MIAGLQKLTLLDFPGKVACTVFLAGCNYRCPFCHNAELFTGKVEPLMTEADFFIFLEGRKGLLEGVCVSGGEPTLTPHLESFLQKIKGLGFAVKLDTNGSHPEILKALVQKGLVDYVAMDVKSSPQGYAAATGVAADLAPIEESLRFLIGGSLPYELRTTLVAQLHSEETIAAMGQWLAALIPGKIPTNFYLQSFVDRDTVIFSGLTAPTENQLSAYQKALSPFVTNVTIRNT